MRRESEQQLWCELTPESLACDQVQQPDFTATDYKFWNVGWHSVVEERHGSSYFNVISS